LAKRFELKKEIERDWIRVRRGDRFPGYRGLRRGEPELNFYNQRNVRI